MGVTTLVEGERYDHAKTQRVRPSVFCLAQRLTMSCPFQQSAKQASYRDSISFPLDRAANRQARPSISSQRPALAVQRGAHFRQLVLAAPAHHA